MWTDINIGTCTSILSLQVIRSQNRVAITNYTYYRYTVQIICTIIGLII